ncbi:hypothetical protein QT776_22410, partial [Xanthomonas citri pv. citri]
PLAPPGAGEAVGEGWADLPIAERPRLVHGARPQGPPVGGSARLAAIGGPGVDVSALAPAHLHPDGRSNTNAGSA